MRNRSVTSCRQEFLKVAPCRPYYSPNYSPAGRPNRPVANLRAAAYWGNGTYGCEQCAHACPALAPAGSLPAVTLAILAEPAEGRGLLALDPVAAPQRAAAAATGERLRGGLASRLAGPAADAVHPPWPTNRRVTRMAR